MRNRYILVGDVLLTAVAAFGAFALRFDWLFPSYRHEFLFFLWTVVLVKPVVLYLFGMYARYWRYASANDLLSTTLAVSAASVVVAVIVGVALLAGSVEQFSRPVLLIDWLLSLTLMGGLRMSVRVVGEQRQRARRAATPEELKRVLVAGAGDAGAMVVRELGHNPQLGIVAVGFVDDADDKQGKSINGVRVLGRLAHLPKFVTAHEVDEVIIAMPAAGGSTVRRVTELCQRASVRSRTVPGVFELLGGRISVNRLRNIEITDLLRREHLAPKDLEWSADYVQGATVLITGAGGSIGRELSRQVVHARPDRLLLLGHGENSLFDVERQLREHFAEARTRTIVADIRDERRIESIFATYRPDVVFHAAAHKHVPLMEENAVEAVSNNVFGTQVVASAAARYRARRFVLISTDKAVSPTSIMGATKRVAEMVVRDIGRTSSTAFVVVRFGNVLDSRGSVVPIFKAQIERGGPVTITHPDVKRFFMTIPEAVNLVLRAAGFGRGNELFVLDMGAPVKIRDLADDLIKLSGFAPGEIPIVTTGLRAGEKLEEALWEPSATPQSTEEPRILRVLGEHDALASPLPAVLDLFKAALETDNRLSVEAALAEQIPTFVPTAGGMTPV